MFTLFSQFLSHALPQTNGVKLPELQEIHYSSMGTVSILNNFNIFHLLFNLQEKKKLTQFYDNFLSERDASLYLCNRVL